MDNLKLYKRGIALLTVATVSLALSGCCKNSDEDVLDVNPASAVEETAKPVIKTDVCEHLSVRFGDEYATFKECQGYDMNITFGNYSGKCEYLVYNDADIPIINGVTHDYSYYRVDHQNYESDVEALQKCKIMKK